MTSDKTIKQELKIIHRDEWIRYTPFSSGQIQLKKLSDTLSILKMEFDNLQALYPPERIHETSALVCLSNYPMRTSNLDDLDGMEIYLEKGYDANFLRTMLGIYDGEEINNNRIRFTLLKKDCFLVEWTGSWGERNYSDEDFALSLVAFKSEKVVTNVCAKDEKLIELFGTGDF